MSQHRFWTACVPSPSPLTPSLPLPLCKTLDIKRTLHFHYGLHLKISQLAFRPAALYQPLQSRPEVLSFADFVPPVVFTHAQRLNRIRKIMQDQAYRPPAYRINFTHLHHRQWFTRCLKTSPESKFTSMKLPQDKMLTLKTQTQSYI